MTTLLYRIGRFSASRPLAMIAIWLAAAIAVVGLSNSVGRELEDSFSVPGLDSQIAVELLSQAHSDQAGLTARVVLTPTGGHGTFLGDPTAVADLRSAQERVAALPNVLGTTDTAALVADDAQLAIAEGVLSADGRIAVIVVQYPVLEDLAPADLDHLVATVEAERVDSSLQIEMGGDLFFAFDEPATNASELVGLAAAVVILLVSFGSVIAMGLPIGMALFGLALGVSSMSLVTYLIEIPSWAPDIGVMVGLGVGIDYALFIVTRHREFLARAMTVEESAGRAVATAGQAVVVAGGTVVIAILGLAVAGVPFVTAAGVAISCIVAIMVIASVTLLPALLGLAGPWIDRFGLHRRTARPIAGNSVSHDSMTVTPPRWLRWGDHVAGHAWPYAIGVTAVLLATAAPVLALRLGFPDEGTQPESATQRRAYDLVADGFGPGVNGPLLIAVDLTNGETDLAELTAAIGSDPGIVATTPAFVDESAGVATIIAYPTTSPQDDATVATIERLRSSVLPDALVGTGVSAHVGGQTATVSDVAGRVSERLPVFIVAVVILSFLLLMTVFRSVLVPLKAALMNLLSIGAAYGVLVMVFQWGWGAGLIGLESTVPIVSFIPMFMFAILFGLSMDYEVFLLSRVREEYLATGDNDWSVTHGLASTARVITSAALIMIAVFVGFVFGDDPTTKMFGLGLATAIFVDATVVRVILVPATMTLLGDANWWLPVWLDRLLPTIDIEGESGLPQPELAVVGSGTETGQLVGVHDRQDPHDLAVDNLGARGR